MQTLHKRFSVITGFILLLILLVANAIITARQLRIQVANQTWVTRTQQVRFELSQTESILKDAETGQRGFLYTADPTYLGPYDLALTQIEPHLKHLEELTADTPDELAQIPELRRLANAKLAELAQTISLFRSGRSAEAKTLVLSDLGLHTMDNIRKLIDEMAVAGETSALKTLSSTLSEEEATDTKLATASGPALKTAAASEES